VTQATVAIRRMRPEDWPAVWPIVSAVLQPGDTYVFAPASSEVQMRSVWSEAPAVAYVACAEDGTVVGSYIIKPNQPGLGSHVCNGSYIVAPAARRQGIASAMCEHSQSEARAMGFRAMQFNIVVATNETAVRLWKKLGFAVVGTLPGAFHHSRLGYVDALVMFKGLHE
jgi:ribosomal protein S18 acetylase RimI-like enzyme